MNTNNNKKIVFGIPTYNGAPTIKRAFDSFMKSVEYCKQQIKCDIRVVFILNGCTDNTGLIVREIISDYSDNAVGVIEIQKKSKPAAINCLSKFNVDFVGYVDDDVMFDVTTVYELVKSFSDDSVWAAYPTPFPILAHKKTSPWRKLVYNALTVRTRYKLLAKKYDLLTGMCVLIRKEKMLKIPEHIINEDQYLDYFLYPHVFKINVPIYYEGVYTLRNNFRRDIRITAGRRQLKEELPWHIINPIDSSRSSSIDYKKLFNLGPRIILLFAIYRIIYKISKFFVKIYLLINTIPQWKRTPWK